MSETIKQNVYEFSAVTIDDELEIEEKKTMVTSGIEITEDGCLVIEGSMRVV